MQRRGSELNHPHPALGKMESPEKKGSGKRQPLIKMLKNVLQGSDNKELEVPETAVQKLVPFGDVAGCLAIHIKSCRYFTPKTILKLFYTNLFIRITINNVVKSTKMCTFQDRKKEKAIINFDEVKYFSVQVPRRQEDARNNVYLELMECETRDKNPSLLGCIQVHLYEIIQKGCFTEDFPILNRNTFICRMEVEFMFSYGNFGFGFSHQLKPLQKITEPSMFMNIAPPPERTEPVSNVITPQPVEYPAFLSPDLNVAVGKPTRALSKSSQPSVVRLEKLQDPPRERLEKMKKEYRNLSTWAEKASYLENIFAPVLELKETKEMTLSDEFGNLSNDQLEENTDVPEASVAPVTNDEVESIPKKPLDYDKNLPTLTLTTLKHSIQGDIDGIPLKNEESETYLLSTDSVLSTVPTIEGNRLSPSYEYQFNPPSGKLRARYPSSIKVYSSPSESTYYAFNTYENLTPHLDKGYVLRNPNEKGKTMLFQPKGYLPPSSRPKHEENIAYPSQTFNIKNGFDPFLRNINCKRPVSKREKQDLLKCRNTLSTEVIEHEDQDPPSLEHPKSAGPTIQIQAPDPETTAASLNNQSKRNLPSGSLPSFKAELPKTSSAKCSFSKLLNLPSFRENVQQAMMLRPISNKNLQNLLDEFFSNPEMRMEIEARMKNYSSPVVSAHNKPSSHLEEEVTEEAQDPKSWLSEKDALNSESALSQIIKGMTTDSLCEDVAGTSTQVEREHNSARHSATSTQNDYIKQIFTAAIFSELLKRRAESRGTKDKVEDAQLLTAWEKSFSSQNGLHYEKEDEEKILSQSESSVSPIMQALPVESLLKSGFITMRELDTQHQESPLVDSKKGSPEDTSNYFTKECSNIKSKTEPPSEQNLPSILQEATHVPNPDGYLEEGQNILPQDSKYYTTPNIKTDLPSNGQRLSKEENDLYTTSKNLRNSLMDKFNEPDIIILKSFLKHIFDLFFKYNHQLKRRQPERGLQSLIQHYFTNDTEDLEEIREDLDRTDKSDRNAVLNPQLRLFLEELSDSEIKNLKSELSKQIQNYLVERLSESGYITKEDLPKIYQNLYLMNKKSEPRGQSTFQERYSETLKEIMSFVHNFHHNFIDKHLEIKLQSFLTEILKKYFLENLSESKFFKETETGSIPSNTSLTSKSGPSSLQDSGQDISRSFDRSHENNMNHPLNKYLQDCFFVLSENELLDLKDHLSKYLQRLFLEKLSKSGLITKRQLEWIYQYLNMINSSSTTLKYVTDLSYRVKFIEDHSEKQNKCSKIAQKPISRTSPEDRHIELIRNEEKEYFPSYSTKENLSTIKEQKSYCSKEEAKAPNLIKPQSASNTKTQASPLNKSPKRLMNVMLKNQRKEHDFKQFVSAENSGFTAQTQDIHCWDSKSKVIESNDYFERTLEIKPNEKKEHVNIYKLTSHAKLETRPSPYPRVPNYQIPGEHKDYSKQLTFPSVQHHTLPRFNPEDGGTSKLYQYYQRLKGNNNNNKNQHSVTVTEYRENMKIPYKNGFDIFIERYVSVPESQSFKCNVFKKEKKSRLFLFPGLLKRESLKLKVSKERHRVSKHEKSSRKIVKMLPTTLPLTKKSISRTWLRWTARTTIHDCSDKFEDLPVASSKHFEKTKSRARLLGKSPGDSHNLSKHFPRPYTAPEVYKRRGAHSGKWKSPRLASAGLIHRDDTISNYEMHRMQQKKQ